jgi:hypothetical protein
MGVKSQKIILPRDLHRHECAIRPQPVGNLNHFGGLGAFIFPITY